jgi:hypothetical protein
MFQFSYVVARIDHQLRVVERMWKRWGRDQTFRYQKERAPSKSASWSVNVSTRSLADGTFQKKIARSIPGPQLFVTLAINTTCLASHLASIGQNKIILFYHYHISATVPADIGKSMPPVKQPRKYSKDKSYYSVELSKPLLRLGGKCNPQIWIPFHPWRCKDKKHDFELASYTEYASVYSGVPK